MRPARIEDPCWVDGRCIPLEQATVSLLDPAVQNGLGLFETLAVRDGRPLDLDEHLRRMAAAAVELSLALPHRDLLAGQVAEACATTPRKCGWLKLLFTAGGRMFVYGGEMDPASEGASIAAVLLPWRRNLHDPLRGLKTLSYAHNAIALKYAEARNAQEGLWLNSRGHLAEGCSSNLFVVCGRKLLTPALGEGILSGIVREITLRAARELGIRYHEGRVRLRHLSQAREAFVTSSARAIRPLVRVQGRPVGSGEPGPMTLRLAAEVRRIRENRPPGLET